MIENTDNYYEALEIALNPRDKNKIPTGIAQSDLLPVSWQDISMMKSPSVSLKLPTQENTNRLQVYLRFMYLMESISKGILIDYFFVFFNHSL